VLATRHPPVNAPSAGSYSPRSTFAPAAHPHSTQRRAAKHEHEAPIPERLLHIMERVEDHLIQNKMRLITLLTSKSVRNWVRDVWPKR
jgi:hypothetical protein